MRLATNASQAVALAQKSNIYEMISRMRVRMKAADAAVVLVLVKQASRARMVNVIMS